MSTNFSQWLASLNPSEAQQRLEATQKWLKQALFGLSWVMLGTVTLSLLLNQTEWRGVNILFVFGLLAVAVYHAIEPFKFLLWFSGGAVYNGGLPNNQLTQMLKLKFADFKGDEFLKAGIKGVQVWWDVLVLLWLAAFLWFMTVATFSVSFKFAPGAIAVLIACLLATLKWPSATKWFKWISWTGITLFGILYIGGFLFAETRGGQMVNEGVESAYVGAVGKSYSFQHVVVTENTVTLSNFRDSNNDDLVGETERKRAMVPAGCYQLGIVGQQVVFSAAPNVSQDLGGIVRIGPKGDVSYGNGDKLVVADEADLMAGIINPVSGSHLINPVTGASTWRTVKVTFTESTGCQN